MIRRRVFGAVFDEFDDIVELFAGQLERFVEMIAGVGFFLIANVSRNADFQLFLLFGIGVFVGGKADLPMTDFLAVLFTTRLKKTCPE